LSRQESAWLICFNRFFTVLKVCLYLFHTGIIWFPRPVRYSSDKNTVLKWNCLI